MQRPNEQQKSFFNWEIKCTVSINLQLLLLHYTPHFNCSVLLPLAIPLLQFYYIQVKLCYIWVMLPFTFCFLYKSCYNCLPCFAPSATLHTLPHLISSLKDIYLHCICPKSAPASVMTHHFLLSFLPFLYFCLCFSNLIYFYFVALSCIRRREGRRGDYILQSGQGLCKIVAKVELPSLERRIRRPRSQSRPTSPHVGSNKVAGQICNADPFLLLFANYLWFEYFHSGRTWPISAK